MSEERLDIPTDLDISAALASLGRLKGSINASVANAAAFESAFHSVNRLAESAQDALSRGVSQIRLQTGELITTAELHQRLLGESQQLAAQYERHRDSLAASVTTLNIQLVSMRELNRTAEKLTDSHKSIEQSARQARIEMQQTASVTVRPPTSPPPQGSGQQPPAVGGGAMIRMAAAAAGGLTVFNKVKDSVRSATATVKTAVGNINTTLDQFNIGRLAAKADPALNLIRSLFTNFGDTVAKLIDWVTTRVDAMVTHWADSAQSGVGALGAVNAALDRMFKMITKHVVAIRERVQAGLNAEGSLIPGLHRAVQMQERLLGQLWVAFDSVFTRLETRLAGSPLAGLMTALAQTLQVGETGGLTRVADVVEGMANKVLGTTAAFGKLEANIAGVAAITTGTMPRTSGVVADYASAVEAAVAPAKILNSTIRLESTLVHGLHAGMAVLRRGYVAVTGSMVAYRNRQAQLNQMLANTPAAYRRAAIAIDWIKVGLRGLRLALSIVIVPIQKLVQAIMAILRPIASLSTLLTSLPGKLLGFGKAAAKTAGHAADLTSGSMYLGSSLISVANAGHKAHKSITNIFVGGRGGFTGMVKSLLTSKLALGAMASAAIAWGGTTAVATETATVKFGTLLRDMDQGKALIQEITTFSAKTPFSNDELRESAGLLLAAQVPADQITNRLQMLGDIAAGTSRPIGEFSQVFQKVANTGKFGLDTINQLAERGVPIYGALQSTLGVTRGELLDMVSDGKLGFADMDKALQSLTSSGGIFAGGMERQSTTFAGLWSTLKDNAAIALEQIAGVFLPWAKRMVGYAITITQGIAAGFAKLRPVIDAWLAATVAVFHALFDGVAVVFNGIWTVVSSVFGASAESGLGLIDQLLTGFITLFASVQYIFSNIGLTWDVVSASISLAAVEMFMDVQHWLTVALPSYMTWFGDNWVNLFRDIGSATMTIFENLFTNIRNVMTAVWDFIKSGGTASMSVAWVPLLDGFEAATKALPNVPERAITEIERNLRNEVDSLSASFEAGIGDAVSQALDKMKPAAEVKLKSVTGADTQITDVTGGGDDKKKNGPTSYAVEARDLKNAETLKSLFTVNSKKDETAKKHLTTAQKSERHLATLARESGNYSVQGAVP